MKYNVENLRNICLLGHGGDGKTSLAEALLYYTDGTDRMGKTADGNTVCDYDPEEIARKISISSAIAPIERNGVKLNIIDTPGQFDFSASVSEGFRAAGSSVIVISGKSGVSVGAQKAFDAASKKGIAKIFFINKTVRGKTESFNSLIVRKFSNFKGRIFAVAIGCMSVKICLYHGTYR